MTQQQREQSSGQGQESEDTPKPASTYNFVPLSAFVHLPEWADLVSQDVPFEDGYCGEIVYTLTAQTPILVAEKRGNTLKTFAKAKDEQGRERAIIRGSSVRGMLRNVLEIASFGKFQRVSNRVFSLRDFTRGRAMRGLYGERLTETVRPGVYRARSRGGWLKFENGRWLLNPCEIARVDQEKQIAPALGIREFRVTTLAAGRHSKQRLSALEGYEKWRNSQPSLAVRFDVEQSPVDGWSDHHVRLFYDRAKLNPKGTESGTLVFTGSVGRKHMEFIFYTPAGQTQATPIDVEEPVMAAFQQVHSEAQQGKAQDGTSAPNETLSDLRMIFEDDPRGIPVFYLTEPDDAVGKIAAIGLSQMFRLPYDRSVHQAIESVNPAHLGGEADLAELVFGRVPLAKKGASSRDRGLRGRVAFGTLEQQPHSGQYAQPLLSPISTPWKTVLGSPKPSFIPYYVAQPNAGTASHLMTAQDGRTTLYEPGSDTPRQVYAGLSTQAAASKANQAADRTIPASSPRGWKRYPVRPKPLGRDNDPVPDWQRAIEKETNPKDSVKIQVEPLPAGTLFKGQIRFHNLGEVELSALFWALTWGFDEQYWHSLGLGRSFGWGGCRVRIKTVRARRNDDVEGDFREISLDAANPIRDAFEQHMETVYRAWNRDGSSTDCGWRESEQVGELLAMADPERAAQSPQELRHPKFILGQINGFANLKEDGMVLPRYGGHWAPDGSREARERTARARVGRLSATTNTTATTSRLIEAGRETREDRRPDLDELDEIAYKVQRIVESDNVKAVLAEAGDVPAARWLRNGLVTVLNDANDNGASWHRALYQPALVKYVNAIRDKNKQRAVAQLILDAWQRVGLPPDRKDLGKKQMEARKVYQRLKG